MSEHLQFRVRIIFYCFVYLSDYREKTQRQDQQQPVRVTETRPHSVREAGEKTPLNLNLNLNLKSVFQSKCGGGGGSQGWGKRESHLPHYCPVYK